MRVPVRRSKSGWSARGGGPRKRAAWEQLAQETGRQKRQPLAAKLASLQADAEAAPRTEVMELVERGEEAAKEARSG